MARCANLTEVYLANFLHLYQPPTQKKKILKQVTEESYRKIFKILLEKKRARVTMNIQGCLTELWKNQGYDGVINQVRKLLKTGRLELVDSAMYHPFMPGLPEAEMVRQIKLNGEMSRKVYGAGYQPKGFFPTEMAYEERVGRVVRQLGYEWIILDEASNPLPRKYDEGETKIYELGVNEEIRNPKSEIRNKLKILNMNVSNKETKGGKQETGIRHPELVSGSADSEIPKQVRNDGINGEKKTLKVFFRERGLSFLMLSAQIVTGSMLEGELAKKLGSASGSDPALVKATAGKQARRGKSSSGYVVTGMDGETFGHHRPGLEQLLAEMFASKKIETVTISDLLKIFKNREKVTPVAATWALMNTQMARNAPFARWNDPENTIHQMQWHLTHLAVRTVNEAKGKIESENDRRQWQAARKLLDKALHSDQYWWASAKPWWSLEMIERGAKELVEAVGACPLAEVEKVREAKDLYGEIIYTGFDWQREGVVENLFKQHQDEELAFGLQLETPDVPEKEYRQVVKRLREQEKQAVKERNYDLAKRFKERLEMLAYQRSKIRK
jgi:hypothetical protein